MIYFVLFVLFVSMLLYVVLAGADLGAGILELFKGKNLNRVQEKMITRAMGPVWEANHIWLILILVILFVGFPKAFRDLSVYLHIPITMVLIGIIGRGTAFTFRHYDAIQDEKSQKYYSRIFSFSSLWTSMWIGIVVGAMTSGTINTTGSFYNVYVQGWFNPFCILMGLFISSLFAYVASTFLVAESRTYQVRELFKRRVVFSTLISVSMGLLLFAYVIFDEHILGKFFDHYISMIALTLSTLILFVQQWFIHKSYDSYLKFLGGAQLFLILLGWIIVQYPQFYYLSSGESMNLYDSASPAATIRQLAIALLIGIILIFPPYIYLMKVFKKDVLASSTK